MSSAGSDTSKADARELAAAAFDLPLDAIPADAAIGTIDAWDSLGHMRLLFAVEERLGRELTTDEAARIVSLEDVRVLLG